MFTGGGEDTPDNTRDFLGIRNQITIIRGAIKDRLRWDFVQTGGGGGFFLEPNSTVGYSLHFSQ